MRDRQKQREYQKAWLKRRLEDPVYQAQHREYFKLYERKKRTIPSVLARQKVLRKLRRQLSRDKIRAQEKASYYRHREKKLAVSKAWVKRNTLRMRLYYRDYLAKHRVRIRARLNARQKIRMATDPNFRLRMLLSARIRGALKGTINKTASAVSLLGCSIPEYRTYLEARFKLGMNWNNWGPNGWTIDHIRPCASFDLTDESNQRKCFHYTNTRPLWAIENIQKGCRIICVHA